MSNPAVGIRYGSRVVCGGASSGAAIATSTNPASTEAAANAMGRLKTRRSPDGRVRPRSITAAIVAIARVGASPEPNAGVDVAVEDVGAEVREDGHHSDQEGEARDRRDIQLNRGRGSPAADARIVEDRLRDDDAAQQPNQDRPAQRDHRNQRISP